jgi:uncharacterized Fe-S cluster-containing protein
VLNLSPAEWTAIELSLRIAILATACALPFGVAVGWLLALLKEGDIFRYRPLGCPITHFARVLKSDRGIVTVHLVGPVHLLQGLPAPEDIGICMVLAFEGTISRGKRPDVGETVRFLPEHCMMQKVHSGVVVHSEGDRVRIEGIDLKVW